MHWLRYRQTSLTDDVIDRWGFANNPTGRGQAPPCSIKRIVLCSGTQTGSPPPGYYASAMFRGGWDTFWEIDFFSLQVRTLPRRLAEEETTCGTSSDDQDVRVSLHFVPSAVLVDNPRRYAMYLDRLDNWCLEHQDEFLPVFAPGERPHSSRATSYHVERIPTFCKSPNGDCLRAALANAVFALDGPRTAVRVLQSGPVAASSLAEGVSWLERKMGIYRCPIPFTTDPLEQWVCRQRSGIYLLRLKGRVPDRGTIDHIVCVDASRALIHDCVEPYAMRLTSQALESCVGDGVLFEKILEIRQLDVQVRREEGKKKRKNDPDKRREQRRRKRETSAVSRLGARAARHT